ncbi:MAG: class I SAM-dependent methyltransferase [Gammaproteobacteria bacterium]
MDKGKRKIIFRQHNALDQQLLDIGMKYSSHSFLANPAGQNIFLYLTAYVAIFSEEYFRKKLSELCIVDWGCGKGHVTYLLQKRGGNIISCDIQNERLDSSFGQETPIIEINNIDVLPLKHSYLLPFDDNSVDVLLSFGVLEHVSNDERSINEISRVLRKGGLFFCFNLPYNYSWTQRLAHVRGQFYHDKLYTKKMVSKFCELNELEVIDIWHRQLFPKNSINYPIYQVFERVDQFLAAYTPLKYLATNIEFVAKKITSAGS